MIVEAWPGGFSWSGAMTERRYGERLGGLGSRPLGCSGRAEAVHALHRTALEVGLAEAPVHAAALHADVVLAHLRAALSVAVAGRAGLPAAALAGAEEA